MAVPESDKTNLFQMVTAGSESLDQSADNTAENKRATREVGCIIGRLATVVKAGSEDYLSETDRISNSLLRRNLVRPNVV